MSYATPFNKNINASSFTASSNHSHLNSSAYKDKDKNSNYYQSNYGSQAYSPISQLTTLSKPSYR